MFRISPYVNDSVRYPRRCRQARSRKCSRKCCTRNSPTDSAISGKRQPPLRYLALHLKSRGTRSAREQASVQFSNCPNRPDDFFPSVVYSGFLV
jgi:hypothetical protein